jgi:hypothetical protein
MASVEIEQLQEAMELGAARERQRIIALLKARIEECNWEEVSKDTGYDDGPCEMCEETRINIALIKGEN